MPRRAHAYKKTKTFLSAIVCHGGIEFFFLIYTFIRLSVYFVDLRCYVKTKKTQKEKKNDKAY